MKVDLKNKTVSNFLTREKRLQNRKLKLFEKAYLSRRRILTRENKSQNWLARKLGISSGYMSQLMDGSRTPSPKLRERIMEIMPGFTWDNLFKIKE